MNENSYEDAAVRDAIREAAAHEPIDTPPIEWTDRQGDVWQEHPTDPQLLNLVRFSNGDQLVGSDYTPRDDVDRQWGELTQTAGAPSTADEEETGWRKSAPVKGEGESPEARKIGNAADELENLTVMLRQAVLDLRNNVQRANRGDWTSTSSALHDSYARAYYLRRELGRVVAALGVGVPAARRRQDVEREYQALIQD